MSILRLLFAVNLILNLSVITGAKTFLNSKFSRFLPGVGRVSSNNLLANKKYNGKHLH